MKAYEKAYNASMAKTAALTGKNKIPWERRLERAQRAGQVARAASAKEKAEAKAKGKAEAEEDDDDEDI